MNFLALDTSSNACSVAVQADDKVVSKHIVEPRAHTRILIPMISESLRECQLDVVDLDAIILGNGPGSFIGMRIGASVAQGLCFGADLNIVPVSSLAVVAAEVLAGNDTEHVVVAQDARMGEVYHAAYELGKEGSTDLIGDEAIVSAGKLKIMQSSTAIAGGAWDRYPDMIENNRDKIELCSNIKFPNARALLELGIAAHDNGGSVQPDQLAPAYLRNKVAEIPQPSAH